jgi:hypothetical protein
MYASRARNVKTFEIESARLKKLLADAMLGNDVLKNPLGKN